ncbi:hypothetical protein SAPIO_CDS3456 [Scedosporium apiospermum]|uniref:Transcription factor CBF/NF-Y/archaeal histone domain-containing protein n=1 Tax=Pseudallescheria apiosperma TaxID=563466 RepID=A0A084GAT9_PSEDA|nr:uncharacterized protein SAPIO_CDS3456 [Scedosporium apiospermum]KEZ44451.1 hypothetical protein SAPIO_CDS3456 [Scedosporium apiospermum]
MSDSPQSAPKDVDQGVQSPDGEEQMNETQDPQSAGLTYEFEARNLIPTYGLMSDDSSSKTPEALRVSKTEKTDDGFDANIRNFAPVARIMKNALPDNAKIAKEAKECMQECVSEFISFITSEVEEEVANKDAASEKCHQEKRKTVNGEDILFAMTSLGFENYAEALKIYLAKYRDQSQSNRTDNQQRPNSQGYGASASGQGGSASGYQGDPNALLAGQQGEGADAGFLYGAQPGHNGAGTEGPY